MASSTSAYHIQSKLPVASNTLPPSQAPKKPPTWCVSITTPNSVAMLPVPKNLATRPAVGGTVDKKVSPITAAKTSITGPVLGASKNPSTATARAA